MARPNPRFDPVSGSVSTPTAPREPRPNPRFGNLEDVWITSGGYTRNLFLEDKLQRDYDNIVSSGDIPIQDMPAQWSGTKYGWRLSTNRATGQRYTDQETVNYLENLLRVIKIVNAQAAYVNDYYPRDKREQKNTSAIETVLDHIKTVIQQGGLVIGDIPKSLGGLAEEYNVKEVHGAEIFNTVVSAHQGSKIFEFLPQASAEEEQFILSDQVRQIINDINNNVIQVPDWFRNNIDWVQTGHINEQEFLTAYNYLVEKQTTAPIQEPATVNESIADNMVTQQVINFKIINGRAIGSIKFDVTNNFNPAWYGKNIVNLVQFKTPNGVTLLVKENRLNFTETERDEVISYDEDMQGNTRAIVESFVWSSATQPTPFSKTSIINISETESPKITTSGFMSAGIAGAIAGLILIGFIADQKRGK